MNTRFLHPAGHGNAARESGWDDHCADAPPAVGAVGRACCCPARPVVQAIMPANDTRPHETELLLCAHHYRVSQHALDEAGALVFVLPGCPDDAFLCKAPDPDPAYG